MHIYNLYTHAHKYLQVTLLGGILAKVHTVKMLPTFPHTHGSGTPSCSPQMTFILLES